MQSVIDGEKKTRSSKTIPKHNDSLPKDGYQWHQKGRYRTERARIEAFEREKMLPLEHKKTTLETRATLADIHGECPP
jgi:hypothetical protein